MEKQNKKKKSKNRNSVPASKNSGLLRRTDLLKDDTWQYQCRDDQIPAWGGDGWRRFQRILKLNHQVWGAFSEERQDTEVFKADEIEDGGSTSRLVLVRGGAGRKRVRPVWLCFLNTTFKWEVMKWRRSDRVENLVGPKKEIRQHSVGNGKLQERF